MKLSVIFNIRRLLRQLVDTDPKHWSALRELLHVTNCFVEAHSDQPGVSFHLALLLAMDLRQVWSAARSRAASPWKKNATASATWESSLAHHVGCIGRRLPSRNLGGYKGALFISSRGSDPLKPDWQRHVLASSGYLELGMIDDAALTPEEIAPEDKTRSEVLGARVAIS
jgi:hypothetical protein